MIEDTIMKRYPYNIRKKYINEINTNRLSRSSPILLSVSFMEL